MLLKEVTELRRQYFVNYAQFQNCKLTNLLSADKSTDGNGVGVSECDRSCTNFPVTLGGAKQCKGCHDGAPLKN